MVYELAKFVLTVPVVVTVTLASLLSVAVAPGSVNTFPSLRLTTASPFKTIMGGVVSKSCVVSVVVVLSYLTIVVSAVVVVSTGSVVVVELSDAMVVVVAVVSAGSVVSVVDVLPLVVSVVVVVSAGAVVVVVSTGACVVGGLSLLPSPAPVPWISPKPVAGKVKNTINIMVIAMIKNFLI